MSTPPANEGRRDASASDGRGGFDFAALYQASYRVLWVIAAGVTNRPDQAADIVHEAAVQALGKLGQFTPGTDFTTWMAQIVRFVARNALRADRRHRTTSLDQDGVAERVASTVHGPDAVPLRLTSDGQLPSDQWHFDDDMMSALNALTDEARACLLLRTIEDMPYVRIASVLSIPQGTAMSHVYRSRQQLRQYLREKRGSPPKSKVS